MFTKQIACCICAVVALLSDSNAADYPVGSIPDSLLKNANVIRRYDEMRVEIFSPDKARIYTHYINTILNEAGDKYADYTSWYDKFNTINSISATLYDAAGKEKKHLRTKDFTDESSFDGISLMGDDRLKKANFYCRDYPYSVEYEEEDEKNGIFSLGYWLPQENEMIAVEHSKLTVITPAGYTFHYRQLNYPGEPVIAQVNGKKTYTWEIKNVTAKLKEPYAPAWQELVTSVVLAPSNFKIGGYEGNMDNWKNYGLFINKLMEGRSALPEKVKTEVHQLTDGLKTPAEKINALYTFLQQNTRYISVQLGIGGWQPFDANYVYNNKYGDCKALSNYMVALLKEAGITARYTLINAGEASVRPLYESFASNQFNHATVCVPMANDTIWLECTSQTLPAAYISNFTGNRQAIMVDENGGHIVNTTYYTADDNRQARNIVAVVDETGKLTADIASTYQCLEQDDLHRLLHFQTKKEQLDELKKSFDIPTYDILSFDYKEKLSAKPVIDETLKLTAENYATLSGKRLFLVPNVLTKSGTKLLPDDDRKYNVLLHNSFTHFDTVRIALPQGYTLEAKPKDVEMTNDFGDYRIRFSIDNNEVACYRYLKLKAGTYDSSSYNNLVSFFNDIYKADRSRFVFVKKEG